VKYRVAVTGLGVVSPVGNSVDAFFSAVLNGHSGVGPITLFDPAGLPTRIAAEVRLPSDIQVHRDRKITFALLAAEQAVRDATRDDSTPLPAGDSAAVSLGVGLELFSLQDMAELLAGNAVAGSFDRRLTFLQTPADLCVHLIALRYGLRQSPQIHVSACAAGADAIGRAFRLVAGGQRRFMLAGGSDSMINPLGVAGFSSLGALSRRNDVPTEASRPFDLHRDGFVLGEGAAVLVLERLDDARARGAPVHAEIVGYGNALDADDISRPHPEGRGALAAMRRALADAGVRPEAVGCVSAHATSTPLNDRIETAALRSLLGRRAADVPVVAAKSMIGHLIAAAGAVETVAAILCLREGVLHPTVNLKTPDPACDLDYVAGGRRRHPHEYALSNSFGFGGQNASLLLRRFDDR